MVKISKFIAHCKHCKAISVIEADEMKLEYKCERCGSGKIIFKKQVQTK